MLTEEEKEACRTATFTGGRGCGWGTSGFGLCPAGRVAVLRGATFCLPPGEDVYTPFEWAVSPIGAIVFRAGPDHVRAVQAMEDVLEWAGFATWDAFLDALEAKGVAIFPAADVEREHEDVPLDIETPMHEELFV